MGDAEEISPEEKLLKVIQEPNSEEGAHTVEASPPAPEPVAEAEAPKVEPTTPEPVEAAAPAAAVQAEAKPKLEIADADIGKGLEVPETGAGKIGAGSVLADDKKKPVSKLGIKTVNNFLLVAAIIAICFIGWEAVSYQLQYPEPVEVTFVDNSAATSEIENISTSDEGLVDIEKVLSAFRKTPIVLFPGVVQQRTVTTTVQPVGPVVPQSDWAKYAKANYQMKGRSRLPGDEGYMAVMSDVKSGKMHFLKAGDKVMVEKKLVEVKEVGARFVKFSDGTVETTVE